MSPQDQMHALFLVSLTVLVTTLGMPLRHKLVDWLFGRKDVIH